MNIIFILFQTIIVSDPINQDGYCSRLSFTSTEGFVTNVNIKRKVNVRNITITNHVTEIVWITPAPTTTTSNFRIYLGVKMFLHALSLESTMWAVSQVSTVNLPVFCVSCYKSSQEIFYNVNISYFGLF